MRLFILFAKEDPKISKAEVHSLLDGKVLEETDEYCVVDGSIDYSRLVFSRYACSVLSEGVPKGLPAYKSFAVRATKLKSFKNSAREVERDVASRIKGKVDLEKGTVIRVFCGDELWVTEELWAYTQKQFKARDVNARPSFNPTSLQPKTARLLLNLANARKNVLDPFCGVGGILLEAGVLGIKATGIELDEKWAEGATENAWFYRVDKKVKIVNADFLEWKGKEFECIVTDLPYGKSSGLFGKKREELYSKAFKKFHTHTGKCVVMAQEDLRPLLKKAGWETKFFHSFYVHKSMRRYIHACSAKS